MIMIKSLKFMIFIIDFNSSTSRFVTLRVLRSMIYYTKCYDIMIIMLVSFAIFFASFLCVFEYTSTLRTNEY